MGPKNNELNGQGRNINACVELLYLKEIKNGLIVFSRMGKRSPDTQLV